MINIFTIGVYGLTKDDFFQKLINSNIDTFCDIRRRRSVRGAKYSFANSKKLQAQLAKLGINYVHYIELAPSDDVRRIQYGNDKYQEISQRERTNLCKAFIDAYKKEHLTTFNHEHFLKALGSRAKNVVLFCVEKEPKACHRLLVTEYLQNIWKDLKVVHL